MQSLRADWVEGISPTAHRPYDSDPRTWLLQRARGSSRPFRELLSPPRSGRRLLGTRGAAPFFGLPQELWSGRVSAREIRQSARKAPGRQAALPAAEAQGRPRE